MRSADAFLGLPFNIASYALLTHMVATVTGLRAGELVMSLADVHLYENAAGRASEQISRTPRRYPMITLPKNKGSLDEFTPEDLTGAIDADQYAPYGALPCKMII